MGKGFYILLAGFLFCHTTWAGIDSLKLDSLIKIARHTTDSDKKINAYNEAAIVLEGFDYVNALAYSDTAIRLAEKSGNEKRKAEALVTQGNVYWYLGDTDKSMQFYLKSLKIREKINDVRGIGISKYNISLLFDALGNVKESLQYAFEAVDQFKNLETVDDLCIAYLHIASMYGSIDSFELDKKFVLMAGKLVPQLKESHVLSSYYLHLGAQFKNNGNFDSALFYYSKSYSYDSIGNNPYGMTAILNNIGLLYAEKGDWKKAIFYTGKSAAISTKNKITMSLKYSYGNLAEYYFNMGDYKSAYQYMSNYLKVSRELYSEESQRLSNEMEAKFQDEKKQLIIEKQEQEGMAKDAKIAHQDEENKRINQQRIFIGAGLGLMIVISILIFRNLQRKKRDNALITAQKEEILHQKEELQEKHNEITDSIDYAKRIQTALLTSDEYWNEISPDHFILFQPKDVVSGDFFWAFQTDTPEGKLAIWCAADCTGHGVPGAFMSMLGISFLNEIVVERGILDAKEILTHLRDRIIKALIQKKGEIKQRDGMDIALCVWNKNTNILEFAGANNPLWIITKNNEGTNELIETKPAKIPVGQFGDDLEEFTKSTIQLKNGDMIYTFSDGFADQFGGPNGKKLRYANFKNMLLGIANLTGIQQKTILAEKFKDWKGSLEQIDDVCVIGIRIN